MPRRTSQFRIISDFPGARPDLPPLLARALTGLRLAQASAAIYDCSPAWRIPHRRQRSDLLLLPLSGRGRVGVDGRWYAIAPRRLVYAVRGSWLQAECDPASPLRLIVLAHRADAGAGVPFAVAAGLPATVQLRDGDGIAERLVAACREDAVRLPGWQAAVAAEVQAALVALARGAGRRCAPPTTAAAGALARIGPALAVMGQDLSQPLRVAELALACGIGQVQFRRLFRTAIGRSPVAHLQRLRLEEAQRLIAGGMLVREAADAVGYRSTTCLDRVFRHLAGTTPGRWRATISR